MLVHVLLLTVHVNLGNPGSTPRMVLNGLRSLTASALPGRRVPVTIVRPAARLRPLNNAMLVFMVVDCYPDLRHLYIRLQQQKLSRSFHCCQN